MPIFECSRCNEMTYSASLGAAGPCASCGSERQRVIEGDFRTARRSPRPLEAGDHAELVYEDPGAIASFCAGFLSDGVQAGERVIAGLQPDVREAVCALLAPETELAIDWREPSSLYGDFDADRVAAMYEALILEEPRPTRILAGLDAESADGVEPGEYARYEATAHAIITAHGATVVCAFDAIALPPAFLEVSAVRHPLSVDDGAARRNEQFEYQPA
jgi:hypothetical protein